MEHLLHTSTGMLPIEDHSSCTPADMETETCLSAELRDIQPGDFGSGGFCAVQYQFVAPRVEVEDSKGPSVINTPIPSPMFKETVAEIHSESPAATVLLETASPRDTDHGAYTLQLAKKSKPVEIGRWNAYDEQDSPAIDGFFNLTYASDTSNETDTAKGERDNYDLSTSSRAKLIKMLKEQKEIAEQFHLERDQMSCNVTNTINMHSATKKKLVDMELIEQNLKTEIEMLSVELSCECSMVECLEDQLKETRAKLKQMHETVNSERSEIKYLRIRLLEMEQDDMLLNR